MRSVLVVLVALAAVACLAAPPASAILPSFAVWSSKEASYDTSLTSPATTGCAKRFVHDDVRAGACIAKGVLAVLPQMLTHWGRGLQGIAKGQTDVCKAALHVYWLAGRKNFQAALQFFGSHRHARASEIRRALSRDPYKSLGHREASAKSSAVNACG